MGVDEVVEGGVVAAAGVGGDVERDGGCGLRGAPLEGPLGDAVGGDGAGAGVLDVFGAAVWTAGSVVGADGDDAVVERAHLPGARAAKLAVALEAERGLEAGGEHIEALEPDRHRVAMAGPVAVLEAEYLQRGAGLVQRCPDVTGGAGRLAEAAGVPWGRPADVRRGHRGGGERDETRDAQRRRGPGWRAGQRERGDTTARPTVFTSAPNQIASVAGS